MEHIFFGVQLFIKISISSEFCEICFIYHPTSGNSLGFMWQIPVQVLTQEAQALIEGASKLADKAGQPAWALPCIHCAPQNRGYP